MSERIFLDNAAWGMPRERVLDCAEIFTGLFRDPTKTTRDITLNGRAWVREARAAVAKLINCSTEEVALVESTTHALGLIANMIPLTAEDNVLICDLEYQASLLCWYPRKDKIGFEIREVKTSNGEVKTEDFEKCMDEHTKAILIAAVQEINGYRADIKELTEMAHKRGCYVIVDGAQQVGAMKVDVKDWGIDAYCATGKKWLCNPFGQGVFYVRKELLKEFNPPAYGYYNIVVPPQYDVYTSYLEDPKRHPFDSFDIVNEANKFEHGGFANLLGALGLKTAIECILDEGPDIIQDRILGYNEKLTKGLAELGINTCSAKDRDHMSSIISFNFGLENNNVDRERALIQYLREKNIFVSLRCCTGLGGIRVSFHYYTPEWYIDAFLSAMKEYLELHPDLVGR